MSCDEPILCQYTVSIHRGDRVKPRLLDLFCGAGGATKGYQLAGFHVTGIDIKPQPNYCGDEFFQADALETAERHGAWREAGERGLPCGSGSTVLHASPPSQAFS